MGLPLPRWNAGLLPGRLSLPRRPLALRTLPLAGLILGLLLHVASAGEAEVNVSTDQKGDAIAVEATVRIPVSQRTAWNTLTDFEHLPAFLHNLNQSRILRRGERSLVVRQEGVARYGLFSFSFESEREIQLEPMARMTARSLSGSAKSMQSETRLSHADGVTTIRYRADVVVDSFLARVFGASFLNHEIDEQFHLMAAEMLRRERHLTGRD